MGFEHRPRLWPPNSLLTLRKIATFLGGELAVGARPAARRNSAATGGGNLDWDPRAAGQRLSASSASAHKEARYSARTVREVTYHAAGSRVSPGASAIAA